MSTPLHSVIMPVLNGAKYIRDGMRSALAELGPDDELIVIDNGSTDGTPDLVREIGDERIRLLTETKRGPAAARNRGLREIRGKYVSFLDHDDLWPPGRLSAMVTELERHPCANAVYGRIKVRYDADRDPKYDKIDGQAIWSLGVIIYLMTAELVRRGGLMDETLMQGEDTDYILRLNAVGMNAVEHDGVVTIYRRHTTNVTLNRAEVARTNLELLARNIARRRFQT